MSKNPYLYAIGQPRPAEAGDTYGYDGATLHFHDGIKSEAWNEGFAAGRAAASPDPPDDGQDFTAWFTTYPKTHRLRGRTVEVVPREMYDRLAAASPDPTLSIDYIENQIRDIAEYVLADDSPEDPAPESQVAFAKKYADEIARYWASHRDATINDDPPAASPDERLREAGPFPPDVIRLCVETHHPIDPGNYEGPIHCLAHPAGHECVTALYARWPEARAFVVEKLREEYVEATHAALAAADREAPDEGSRRIDTVIGPVKVMPECKAQAVCVNGSRCWEAGRCLRPPVSDDPKETT